MFLAIMQQHLEVGRGSGPEEKQAIVLFGDWFGIRRAEIWSGGAKISAPSRSRCGLVLVGSEIP